MSYDHYGEPGEDPSTPMLIGYAVMGILDICMVVGAIAYFACGWTP